MKAPLENLREELKETANLDFKLQPRRAYMGEEYKYVIYQVGMHDRSGWTTRGFKNKDDALKYAKGQMRKKSQVVTTVSYYWTCPAFY